MEKQVEKAYASFQLIGTNVSELNLKNDFINFQDNGNDNIDKKINIEYTILDISEGENKGDFIGTLSLNIRLEITDTYQDDRKIQLNMVINGGFICNDMSRKEFEHMLQINGAASLLSIARATILSVTSQTVPGSQIIIPLINITKIQKNNQ